jgi:hypothetical protein
VVSTSTDRCVIPVRYLYLPTPSNGTLIYYLKGRLPTVVRGAKYNLSSQSNFFFSFIKKPIYYCGFAGVSMGIWIRIQPFRSTRIRMRIRIQGIDEQTFFLVIFSIL